MSTLTKDITGNISFFVNLAEYYWMEVTPECLKYSENIDCRFYECLDKRYPCHKEHMGMENPYKHCKEDVAVAKTLNDVIYLMGGENNKRFGVRTGPGDDNGVINYVTPKCLKHSENVNCKFYKCLDERFPCHPETKKQHTSYRQCRRALNVAKTLNDVGKIWINSIIGCFMNELTDMYKSDTLDCNSILEKTLAIQHTCYMKNDFCEVGWDNREGLWQIFKRPIEKSKSQHYKALWENIETEEHEVRQGGGEEEEKEEEERNRKGGGGGGGGGEEEGEEEERNSKGGEEEEEEEVEVKKNKKKKKKKK
ncbi:XP_029651305.1uncharacterized protein LOC115224535 [Octopus vulgaris]|uniref:XP_029651305.1uncharacterized protein LOC115224535 n=1 Tax=Octopus vulgaris TaxID=6645 RepID=A0AA36BWF5_OCTVU|nr:XP_029651305.1uncharacterized protein LOC115224535 [Octopus vulgaris]